MLRNSIAIMLGGDEIAAGTVTIKDLDLGRALSSGVADNAAAFSPDGAWIAFGRTPANTAAGRRLWLMRADGSDARPLTNDPAVTHGPPVWSPDGRTLLFQRYDPAEETTSVWRLDVATGAETLVAEGGYLPGWLVR